MKKAFLLFAFILSFAAVGAYGQKPEPKNTPPAVDGVQADPIYEEDALANLEAARTYFRPRKAYIAVIKRFDETYVAYPIFSKIDEFLYLAGMSSFYLSENKGKQKLDASLSDADKERFTPDNMKADAKKYLTELVERFPKSKFADDAKKTLKTLEK